jgi:nucleoside-diphosphate-sugar epimerase
MRVLVTGATGFIGGRLVGELLAGGHEVRAIVRDTLRARPLEDTGVQVFRGDVLEKESLRAPMAGVDGVYHVAGWYDVGSRDKSRGERVNVQGTRHVLEMMRDLGISKGVYTSTVGVFGDTGGRLVDETYRRGGPWLTAYDYTKWKAHYEVAEPMIRAGLPLVVVQPGVVYGPGDRSLVHHMLLLYLQRKLQVAPQRTAYCFAHVEDVARGHVLAMEKGVPGESYILAGPMHTFIEVFELAERVTGVPAPRWRPRPWVLRALASATGLLESILPVPLPYRSETLRVIAGITYAASSAKAERDLGWTARPLAAGLPPTLQECMRELGMQPRSG